MKLFKKMKDGGKESRVTGYWLAEIKSLFSIVLLHFADGSREAYHSHAFNSLSLVLKGRLVEQPMYQVHPNIYEGWDIVKTPRSMFHKVTSRGDTWVLSLRGPWKSTWREFLPQEDKFITLTHGRKIVG